MSRRVGLTLGKYAPFHKGHQLVIETALSEMDEVIVVIYDAPDVTNIPLNIRAEWIKKLYPQVKVIEAWDGPTEVGDSEEIKQKHEKYIINNLGISNITAFYSSEFYGKHISIALNALNRQVDPKRKNMQVSGSIIRDNPYSYRAYLESIVYRDLIMNVVFLGAPSTGKTTIAERIAQEFNTVWMPEYGREYWEKNQIDRRLSLEQLVEIAETHNEKENEKILEAKKYLFTDTNALTTYVFSKYYHGSAHERLSKIAKEAESRYDLVFLCDIDMPYDDTWDRSGNVNRYYFQRRIVADLHSRKIPYFLLQGDIEERVHFIKNVLKGFEKFMNPYKHYEAFIKQGVIQWKR